MDELQISYAALRALALSSREQLIREQREDPELGHIYRYLENLDDGSINATVCEGSSHQLDTRQCKSPTEESRQGARVQYDRAGRQREHLAKDTVQLRGRPVRSRQTTAVRPCPYYLGSLLKEPEGIPEEQRSTGINSLLQNSLRRRSLSMETLDGDPADRSE
ncbi:uncharacterized protein TNCV_2988281 [Trichonephila clavipes]|nr:uncharacterized protein TNCV_2988281 [Trichonephila clavipes]